MSLTVTIPQLAELDSTCVSLLELPGIDKDIIPATGALDSAAILELVVWYEKAYDFPLKQEEINIDNLGSINAMTDFLLSRKDG